ncbi:MAG: GbsR/MarR family transcriptional regulator, partial [Stackebrandtia sp.]
MEGETNPQRDEETVRAFIENFSLMLSERGVPRMAARVSTVMMTAEQESLTASDIADRLGVSAAAVSGALKYLLHVGLFVRESIPNTRRDRYRFADDNWYSAAVLKMDFMNRAADEAEKVM